MCLTAGAGLKKDAARVMGEKTSPYLNQSQRSLVEALADLERVHAGRAATSHGSDLVPSFTRDTGDPKSGNGNGNGNGSGNGDGHGNGGSHAGAGAERLDPDSLDDFLFGNSGLADMPAAAPTEEWGADGFGTGNGNGGGHRAENGFGREYYLRSAARAGHDAAPNGGNGSGSGRPEASPRINPFAGPGRVDPTLQFVQSAIQARPALTEEIVTAALKLSPDQAHKIVLAAIRANPRAKTSILRIARNAGANGLRLAMSLIVALFLYELFGQPNVAEANEDEDAYARKLSIPESYIAWFTSAAVTMAILFDDETIAKLRALLELKQEDDRLSFQDVIDQLADQETVDAALLNELYGTQDAIGAEAAGTVSRSGSDAGGDGPNSRFDAGDLGNGLQALGAIEESVSNDGTPQGGGGRFSTPNFDPASLGALRGSEGLGDEIYDPGDVPDDDPEDDSEDPEEPDGPPPDDGDSAMATGDTAAEEAAGTVTFMVSREGGLSDTATVDFATVDGSALAGSDFVATSGTLTFAPGVSAMPVVVQLLSDLVFESAEQFGLHLSNPGNGEIAAGGETATATISDSDGDNIRWSLEGDQVVSEGDGASYTLRFDGAAVGPGQSVSADLRLELPGGAGGASAADLTDTLTAAIQAAVAALGPGSGVTFDGTTITFAHGAPASLSFTLGTLADGLAEGVENFTLVLDNPSVGALEPGGSLVTTAILDADGDAVTWSLAGDNMVTEGQSAAYSIGYAGAALAPGQTASVTIDFELPGDGSGAATADFAETVWAAIQRAIDALGPDPGVSLSGNVLTFEAGGPTRLDFDLRTATDDLAEPLEGYAITIGAPTVGSVASGAARKVTLIDDASLQNLTWSLTGDFLVREGGAPAYTVAYSGVTLAAGMLIAIDLAINLPDGIGGANAADFRNQFLEDVQRSVTALGPDSGVELQGSTLIFTEGAPSSLTFELPTFNDTAFEDVENFTVLLQNPSDGTILPGRHLITTAIFDDDRPDPIVGTDGDDTIDGTDIADDIQGLGGNDFIRAGAGADVIDGGAGDDILLGEAGNDYIIGNLGDDTLRGGSGNDILEGGPGLDDLDGGSGSDILRGGAGADRLTGGSGADRFVVSAVDIGTGPDRIEDFNPAEGDEIHVLDLLGGLQDTMVNLDDFIRFQERGGDTVVQADTDGSATGANFVDALVIANVTGLDLEQMMQQGSVEIT